MKGMFYFGGFPHIADGRCDNCPFWVLENSRTEARCIETDDDVIKYVLNGRINKNCPYITKDES